MRGYFQGSISTCTLFSLHLKCSLAYTLYRPILYWCHAFLPGQYLHACPADSAWSAMACRNYSCRSPLSSKVMTSSDASEVKVTLCKYFRRSSPWIAIILLNWVTSIVLNDKVLDHLHNSLAVVCVWHVQMHTRHWVIVSDPWTVSYNLGRIMIFPNITSNAIKSRFKRVLN